MSPTVHEIERRAVGGSLGPGTASSDLDLISGMSSLISAVIAVITLFTVYLAAYQVISKNQQYRLGTSGRSLGPWKSKVVSPSLLRLQTSITTPKLLSLEDLVNKNWYPDLTFPIGFQNKPQISIWKRPLRILRTKKQTLLPLAANLKVPSVLAEASWVNFLESIDVLPEKEDCYNLQSESDLINGIVPMRWKGPDLVAIGALLGFQSGKSEPSFREPMPLPMQWSGPSGWLQFRQGTDSCIVEFRRRRNMPDQLSRQRHEFYEKLVLAPIKRDIKARLWQSINGLYLSNGHVLYLGGADKRSEKRHRNQDGSIEAIMREVQNNDDFTEEELRARLWGPTSRQPDPVRSAVKTKGLSRSDLDSLPEFLRDMNLNDSDDFAVEKSKKVNLIQTFKRCPGLLSVIVEGEWTTTRGLDITQVEEFDRQYVEHEIGLNKSFPYHLGKLYVDKPLLELLKDALLLLRPDGYYFTPTPKLGSDILHIYKHIAEQTDKMKSVVSKAQINSWKSSSDIVTELSEAMNLCNEFQNFKVNGRAIYTIRDMKIVSIASASLRKIITKEGSRADGFDLSWALISCPKLLSDFVHLFNCDGVNIKDVLATTVTSHKILNCKALTDLKPSNNDSGGDNEIFLDETYEIPLLESEEERNFTGDQVLAAYLDVMLTFFWIEKAWITDVAMYDVTVPQSITMC